MAEHILVEVQVDAPAGRVWEALRDPALLCRWFGWDYPGLEDEVRAIFDKPGIEEEHEGGVRLLRFATIETLIGTEPHDEETTTVWLAKTTAEPPSVSEFDVIDQGWITFLQQLRFGLGQHDLAERRTLHWDAEGGAPMTLELLGLGATTAMPIGERYFGVLPWGETAVGRIWHRSAYQTGLTLDDYGPGLLVVAARPGGGGKLILTTYGLDDGAFDAVLERWGDWFDGKFSSAG